MTQKHRTRKLKRIKRKLPSGNIVVHYEKAKPKIPHCAICRKPLSGMPRLKASILHRLPKSQKRPKRAYAGIFCSKCAREKIKEQARSLK